MADEKKISAKQAGIAVLKKFEELLLKASKEKNISVSDLTKAEEMKKDEMPPPTVPGGTTINSAIGNPFGKAEGEEAGIKGHHKLAKFIGRLEGKRSSKGMNQDSGNNTPTQPIANPVEHKH